MRLLSALVQQHKSRVLCIDGVASAGELSGNQVDFKKFVHNLNSVLGLSGCTTFLLSSVGGEPSAPEYTMVDGIVHLSVSMKGMTAAREIEVTKFRGSQHLYGRHFFQIDDAGITVFPRFEAVVDVSRSEVPSNARLLSIGVDGLDRLMGGGVATGSLTSIMGPAGTSKTTIGIQFLAQGAQEKQRGLFLNLYESIERLIPKMKALGVDIDSPVKNGEVRVLTRRFNEFLLDSLFYKALEIIRDESIERVFIDGVGALKQKGVLGCERVAEILKSLTRELKSLGVTTLMVEETDFSIDLAPGPISLDSAITDNIIELKSVHLGSRRTVILNVLKNRSTNNDPGFYEIDRKKRGAAVGQPVIFNSPHFATAEYAKPETPKSRSGGPKRK